MSNEDISAEDLINFRRNSMERRSLLNHFIAYPRQRLNKVRYRNPGVHKRVKPFDYRIPIVYYNGDISNAVC